MSHRILLMKRKKRSPYDEGTSFPAQYSQLTSLYRYPDYLQTPIPLIVNPWETYYAGNMVYRWIHIDGSGTRLTQETSDNRYQVIASGTNIYNLQLPLPKQTWGIWIFTTNYSGVIIGNMKLHFEDGSIKSFRQAVEGGYISPLLLFSSNSGSQASVVTNVLNLYDSGSVTCPGSPVIYIYFKPLRQGITGIEFYSSRSIGSPYKGFAVDKYSNLQFSLSPINL
jgi:hypothetical protein